MIYQTAISISFNIKDYIHKIKMISKFFCFTFEMINIYLYKGSCANFSLSSESTFKKIKNLFFEQKPSLKIDMIYIAA